MSREPRRRRFIRAIGSAGVASLAGCLGGGEGGTGNESEDDEDEDESLTVTSEDHDIDDPVYSLTVRYATKTVEELPNRYQDLSAAEGNIFVILQARINVSSARDGNVNVPEDVVGLRVNGDVYEAHSISSLPSISNSVLPPAAYRAWARFEIPEDVTEATLVAVQPGYWFPLPTAVAFEADESIPVSL